MGEERNGFDGVRAASTSTIEIDFYFNGMRCRERLKLTPSPANLRLASKLKARIEHEIASGEFNYAAHFPKSKRAKGSTLNGEETLETYLEHWLDRERSILRFSTHRNYSRIAKAHLIPSFGKLGLSELTTKHIRDWINAHPDMSAVRTRDILTILRTALQRAVENERIAANPVSGIKLRKRNHSPKPIIDPFNTEERQAILDALDGQHKNLIQFAFWTGLRTSELCGLDWSAVNWDKRVVSIHQVLIDGMTEPEPYTKTESSCREVKILEPALEALERQKLYTLAKGREIFQNPFTLERWTGDHPIRRFWTDALARAGVRYRRPYQTRHTYASMMLAAGEPLLWVSRQMGHASGAITLTKYARHIPDDMPDAGNKAVLRWS